MGCSRLAFPGRPGTRRAVLALSGVAGALAFPTTDWSVLAWVWLGAACPSSSLRSPPDGPPAGWLAVTVFFGVLLRWLDHTFQNYSAIPWPVTWLPIAALSAYCGLYTGLVCAAIGRLRGRLGDGWALAVAPALWVAGEW